MPPIFAAAVEADAAAPPADAIPPDTHSHTPACARSVGKKLINDMAKIDPIDFVLNIVFSTGYVIS